MLRVEKLIGQFLQGKITTVGETFFFVLRIGACWIFYSNPFAVKPAEVNDLATQLWLDFLSTKEKVTVDCVKGIPLHMFHQCSNCSDIVGYTNG